MSIEAKPAGVMILTGTNMDGNPEPMASLKVAAGESIAVVGPTGSGKSQLLSDIEQLAEADTISGRKVILNGFSQGTGVAHLSQKTAFLMDGSVEEFIGVHAESRGLAKKEMVPKVIETANTLCGEPIAPFDRIQVLSGGQSRALMIADIALISDAPIMLIDEIENAGIDKLKAIEVLTGSNKAVFISTHDPVLILMAHRRVVMNRGGMGTVLERTPDEKKSLAHLKALDDQLIHARETLRSGQCLQGLS